MNNSEGAQMKKQNSRQLFKTGFSGNEKMIKLSDLQLMKLKQILLEMLSDFITVANKYSLNYTMSGGSVLGTVRHGGFIPWDDDIDINLPRKDYNIFLKIFEQELGDRYVLCSPEYSHDHGMLCAQMKKKGTVYRSFNELSKEEEACGICMDIFVVENTYNNPLGRRMHGMACLVLGYISTCRKTFHDMHYIQKYLEKGSAAEKIFRKKARIGGFFCWLSLDHVTRIASGCYSACKNTQSKYVSIPSGRGHFFGELQLREDLCETVEAQFEGTSVRIPQNSDRYLSSLYGNYYMQLPPLEKRESHPIMEIEFEKE